MSTQPESMRGRTRIPVLTSRLEPHLAQSMPEAPWTSASERQHESALAEGSLLLQRCQACAEVRYPICPVCPGCSAREWSWTALDGHGVIHSGVTYHRAFHPAFADLVPYAVVVVHLDDGPLVPGRFIGDADAGAVGRPVSAVAEIWTDRHASLAFTDRATR